MATSLGKRKKIALVAHDNRKPDLIEWSKKNAETLSQHDLCGTGTTASLISKATG